jgi:hypothetical protein
MEVIITLKDTKSGHVDVEEVRLPCSGETVDSITTATTLADEILSLMDSLGDVE